MITDDEARSVADVARILGEEVDKWAPIARGSDVLNAAVLWWGLDQLNRKLDDIRSELGDIRTELSSDGL